MCTSGLAVAAPTLLDGGAHLIATQRYFSPVVTVPTQLVLVFVP